jgi:protein-tyrosine phosphatase
MSKQKKSRSSASKLIKKMKRPILNFRYVNMRFDGNKIIVFGMAHPNKEKKGEKKINYINNSIANIRALGIKHMISLDGRDGSYYIHKFKKANINYYNHWIPDFHVLPLKSMKNIYLTVAKLASENENVLIHCSEGWGRTGSTLTALYLLSDAFITKSRRNHKSTYTKRMSQFKKKAKIKLGFYDQCREISAPKTVVDAIKYIRKHDKLKGNIFHYSCPKLGNKIHDRYQDYSVKNKKIKFDYKPGVARRCVKSMLEYHELGKPAACSVEESEQVKWLSLLYRDMHKYNQKIVKNPIKSRFSWSSMF